MKHYVIATQQPWGVKVFDAVQREREQWALFTPEIYGVGERGCTNLASLVSSVLPRYVFFVNYSSYVPPNILAMSEPVNFHSFGPIPGVWHRGGGPIEGLILRGYTETMIWAHRMVEAVDAGDVYASRGPVSLAGTKEQILDRFIDPVVELVKWIVAKEPEPYPQVGEVVTFKRLPKAEYEKFWRERA